MLSTAVHPIEALPPLVLITSNLVAGDFLRNDLIPRCLGKSIDFIRVELWLVAYFRVTNNRIKSVRAIQFSFIKGFSQ